MEEQAVRGVRWTFLGYALTRAIGVVGTLVLARLLLPGDIGVMALATALVGLIGHLTGLGLGPAFVVRQDLDRPQQRTAFSLCVLAGVGTAAVVAGLAPLAGRALRNGQTTSVMLAVAVPLVFSGVTLFYESTLQRELRFRPLFVARAASAAAGVGLSIVLAAAGAGVWSLVGGWILGQAVMLAVLLARSDVLVRPAWDRAVAASLLRSGWGFVLQSVFSFVEQNSDYVVVGRTLGASPLGSYSMAFRIAELPYESVVEPIAQATFPGFARLRQRGEDPGRAFLGLLRLTSVCVVPFGMVLVGASVPAVRTVLGPRWSAVTSVLPILAVWGTVRGVSGTIGWFVSSMGHAARLGRAYSAQVLVSIPFLVVAVQHLGLPGAGLVMLANALVNMAIGSTIASRRLGVSRRRQWDAARPAILAGMPGALAGAAAAAALRGAPAAVALAGAGVGAVAVYLAVLSLQDPGLVGGTVRQLRRVVRGSSTAVVESPAADAPPG